jgi:hypothetical protein
MGFQDMPEEAPMAPPAAEGFCGGSPAMTMLIVAAVFVAFTPGIMVRVGQGYGKYAVAIIHGVVVALILSYMFGPAAIEGFQRRYTVSSAGGGMSTSQVRNVYGSIPAGIGRGGAPARR